MSKTNSRIAFLDAARAFAACLGIVLHVSAGFVQTAIPEWPRFSNQYNIIFDFLTSGIHMFRVPAFFFLAGFFSFTLLKKLSLFQFVDNRLRRIVLPFVVCTVLIHLPLLINAFVTNRIHSAIDFMHLFSNVSYLWFLEYLIVFYAVIILGSICFKARLFRSGIFRKYLTELNSERCLGLGVILVNFFCLYKSHRWLLPTLLNYIPDTWLLGIYGSYFFAGLFVAAQSNRDQFFGFKWHYGLISLLATSTYLYLLLFLPHSENLRILAIALYALGSYLLFINFMALCLKFFSKQNGVITFIANASYWIYISQIGFIILLQPWVFLKVSSIYSRFIVLTALTLTLSLLTYGIYRLLIITPALKKRGASIAPEEI